MTWRRRLRWSSYLLAGAGAVLALGGQVQAYEMPNPGDFSAGNNVYTEVAIANDVTNTLNVPNVNAKFYFNPGDRKLVDIFDGCHSLGNNFQGFYEHDADPRSPFPPTPNAADNCDHETARITLFEFYALDANGNQKSGIPDVTLNGQNMARNWWSSFDLSGINSDLSLLSNKVEVLMVARFADPVASTGYINAFRLGTPLPGSFIGYAGDRDFAMQRRGDRHWPPGRAGYHYDESYTVRFSQPCNDLSVRDRIIRWRDADAGAAGIPQDWNVNFRLERAPKGDPGAWGPVEFAVFAGIPGFPGEFHGFYNGYIDNEFAIGGNGGSGLAADRYLSFRSEPGWNYRWSWNGIEENNGILANIPYDSGLAEVGQCGVIANIDGDQLGHCDALAGWSFDTQNTAALLSIHAYFDGSTTPMVFTPHWQPSPPTQSGSPAPGTPPSGRYIVEERPDVAAAYPGVGPWHGFRIPASQFASRVNLRNGGVHTVDLYAISASGGPPRRLRDTPIQIGPCVELRCSNLSITPANPEPGEPFSVSVGFTTVPAALVPLFYDVSINFPGVINGNQSVPPRLSPPNVVTFNNLIQNTPGQSHVNDLWTVHIGPWGSIRTLRCPGSYTIGSKPYLKVFGNDTNAGGNMSSVANQLSCAAPISPNSGIATYSIPDGGGRYKGAGVQYAASALGKIFDFPSAHHNPAASNLANSPRSLSFANNVAGLPFGGQSNNPVCVPDYIANYTDRNPGATPASTNNLNITPGLDGVHYIRPTQPALVIGGGNIGRNRSIILYVDGDVRIDGDINFSPGAYGNERQIPYFQLVARGNIYITNGVRNLDGVYVAQGDDPRGVIITCAQAEGSHGAGTFGGEVLYNQCRNQLKVNGAFTARQIKFLRTNGTLRTSSVNEASNSPNIAEVFNFTPEIYMAKPPDSLIVDCALNCSYKSITSLPPIL